MGITELSTRSLVSLERNMPFAPIVRFLHSAEFPQPPGTIAEKSASIRRFRVGKSNLAAVFAIRAGSKGKKMKKKWLTPGVGESHLRTDRP